MGQHARAHEIHVRQIGKHGLVHGRIVRQGTGGGADDEARRDEAGTPVSFCGEDAGRPLEALCFAAMGLRTLSIIERGKALIAQDFATSSIKEAVKPAKGSKQTEGADQEIYQGAVPSCLGGQFAGAGRAGGL